MKVIPLDLSIKNHRDQFIQCAFDFYKDDPYWVPPLKLSLHDLLNPKTHPFYRTSETKAFIIQEDTKPQKILGRIMAIYNRELISFTNENCGGFGFFECIGERKDVAKLLFNAAEDWLRSKGIKTILGPLNPSTNYECGLLVQGFFDPPQIMMTYNPQFYAELIEDNQYQKKMDLLAYHIPSDFILPPVIQKIAQRLEEKSHITFRNVDLKNWQQEVDLMFEIYNSAWEDNWGFVPMKKEEFYHSAKELKMFVEPSLIQFVLVKGVVAGFILTLVDLNQILKQIPNGKLFPTGLFKLLFGQKKYITRTRTITMGIKKEFRKMGLETILYKQNYISLQKLSHVKEFEMSWILENNLEMNKPLLTMGAKAYKTYRLYEKTL